MLVGCSIKTVSICPRMVTKGFKKNIPLASLSQPGNEHRRERAYDEHHTGDSSSSRGARMGHLSSAYGVERFRFEGKQSTSSTSTKAVGNRSPSQREKMSKDPPPHPTAEKNTITALKTVENLPRKYWRNEQTRSGFYTVPFIFLKILFTKEQSGGLSVARHISASCESSGTYVRKELCGKRGRQHPGGELEGFLYPRKRILQWSAAFINLQRWQATCKKNKLTDTSILKAGFAVYVEHVSVFWHQIQVKKKELTDLHVVFLDLTTTFWKLAWHEVHEFLTTLPVWLCIRSHGWKWKGEVPKNDSTSI